MVHGRLKPSNVMLTSDNKVKLAEYGRVFRLSDEQIINNGYMSYTAPELFGTSPKFVHKQSVASDIYAYGMTLYYLFTKQIPYDKASYDHVKEQSKKEQNDITKFLDSSSLPNALKDLIKLSINPQPDKRASFLAILKNIKPFDKIILENLAATQGDASSVWGEMKPAVPWKDFMDAWKSNLGHLSAQQEKYLRAFMWVPLDSNIQYVIENGKKTKIRHDPLVKKTDFDAFASAYGPIKKDSMAKLFQVLHALVEATWFFGRMSYDDARYACRGGKDIDKKKYLDNTYLVYQNSFEHIPGVKIKEDHFVLAYRANNVSFDDGVKFDFEAHVSGKEELSKQVTKQLDAHCHGKKKDQPDASKLQICKVPRNPVFRRINPPVAGGEGEAGTKPAGTDIGYIATQSLMAISAEEDGLGGFGDDVNL